MKVIKGTINSIPVVINVPETLEEYREGARIGKGLLQEGEGYLFNFRKPTFIKMENSGVHHDLTILYFPKFLQYAFAHEVRTMEKNSNKIIESVGVYEIALELRTDFCKQYNIKEGSILALSEPIE